MSIYEVIDRKQNTSEVILQIPSSLCSTSRIQLETNPSNHKVPIEKIVRKLDTII